MFFIALVWSLSLTAVGQQEDNEWLDPYDMLNYDASTKTMRKPTEPASYDNVGTKRREYNQDSSQTELTSCKEQVEDLQKQNEDQKKTIKLISQQPTCSPVFKRFLSRLLKEIQRVGVPSDSTDVFFDAKVKLSKQAMTEIQTLLEGEDRWRTGALDNAISQILVDLKPHDYEAWKWRFEDTFGVELDTVLKIGSFILIIVAIISTELWTTISWFVQFRRLFAVCFFVSIIWNWFYLYKIAFAEHQNNIVKMEGFNAKCTGVKKIDWSDSLKEWFRSTWTLQDDPCKRYYEVLMVNPILLVPPTKAISVTITTFITEPLKHFGQGISEFLRALLKDLPVTLQIPVLLTIVIAVVVFMYGSVQAAFQHGIMAPLRRPRRDPPPPELEQPQAQPRLRIEDRNHFAGGDAPQQQHALRYRADDARLNRNDLHQRRPNRQRVETLGTAEDEPDAERAKEVPEADQNPSVEPDSENQRGAEERPPAAKDNSVGQNKAKSEPKAARSDSSESKNKTSKGNENLSQDQPDRDVAVLRPELPDVQPVDVCPEASLEDSSLGRSVNFKAPVQETGGNNEYI
ncbi:chloride channel CLIC-like protein 1 [Haplochromis burtoni]|uniref:chloride channel CLIC-like protein 1 n=1 Tax=Haplochromis burtoni TaxID=8153 RepID=UPI0003BD870F|nr:chloride channel CLIC-like protein 1 [Haplochromis burtoni]XP_005931076.1 chloride channel CLIC-like protein 1 [Haplochromis burtoni]XP_042080176.1 chloride channel CLIC-like protein 1 [Haplochromis burtoni]